MALSWRERQRLQMQTGQGLVAPGQGTLGPMPLTPIAPTPPVPKTPKLNVVLPTHQYAIEQYIWRKYLLVPDTSQRGFKLRSPYSNKSDVTSLEVRAHCDCGRGMQPPPHGHRCGIYGYWCPESAVRQEGYPTKQGGDSVAVLTECLVLPGWFAAARWGMRVERIRIDHMYFHEQACGKRHVQQAVEFYKDKAHVFGDEYWEPIHKEAAALTDDMLVGAIPQLFQPAWDAFGGKARRG